SATAAPATGDAAFKDAFLAEIRKAKVVFYQTVIAQAQKIEVTSDAITLTFSPSQRALRDVFEQQRGWLESVAERIAGRKVALTAVQAAPAAASADSAAPVDPAAEKKSQLRERALADASVQTLLEVFPAEIRDVEEM